MTHPHRNKPSDLPYHATRWIDVGARLLAPLRRVDWPTVIAYSLVGAFVVAVTWAMVDMVTRDSAIGECRIACHPVQSEHSGGECWCLPPAAPAYRAGGAR